jgi:hypothetical protein
MVLAGLQREPPNRVRKRIVELARIVRGQRNGLQPVFTAMSESGLVSRVSPVQTALRNCTRDEGRSFEVGNQGLISSRRKLLLSKATVVNVAETSD